jgi:hypothetical protein
VARTRRARLQLSEPPPAAATGAPLALGGNLLTWPPIGRPKPTPAGWAWAPNGHDERARVTSSGAGRRRWLRSVLIDGRRRFDECVPLAFHLDARTWAPPDRRRRESWARVRARARVKLRNRPAGRRTPPERQPVGGGRGVQQAGGRANSPKPASRIGPAARSRPARKDKAELARKCAFVLPAGQAVVLKPAARRRLLLARRRRLLQKHSAGARSALPAVASAPRRVRAEGIPVCETPTLVLVARSSLAASLLPSRWSLLLLLSQRR